MKAWRKCLRASKGNSGLTEKWERVTDIYILAAVFSLVCAAMAYYGAKLVERKIGGSGDKVGISFGAPVFVLFLAANIYLEYTRIVPGHKILMNVLLITAAVSAYQDLRYREIEDEIHIAALVAAAAGLAIRGFEPLDSLWGLLAGGGTLLIIAILTRGGMGGADIKLNAVYGLILGLRLTVLSLLIAFIAGAVVSLLLIIFRLKGRKDSIPFSPFLSIGALISYAFGEVLINMYLGI